MALYIRNSIDNVICRNIMEKTYMGREDELIYRRNNINSVV